MKISVTEFTLQIFGEDIKDASVHGDRLVVYHQKGSIFRIYSLYRVIANSTVSGAKLGQRFDLDDYCSGIVGDPDFGIPVAKITGIILYTSVVHTESLFLRQIDRGPDAIGVGR